MTISLLLLKIILTFSSVFLIIGVILRPPKSSGLSSTISGGAEQLFTKERTTGFNKFSDKIVKISATLFILSALLIVLIPVPLLKTDFNPIFVYPEADGKYKVQVSFQPYSRAKDKRTFDVKYAVVDFGAKKDSIDFSSAKSAGEIGLQETKDLKEQQTTEQTEEKTENQIKLQKPSVDQVSFEIEGKEGQELYVKITNKKDSSDYVLFENLILEKYEPTQNTKTVKSKSKSKKSKQNKNTDKKSKNKTNTKDKDQAKETKQPQQSQNQEKTQQSQPQTQSSQQQQQQTQSQQPAQQEKPQTQGQQPAQQEKPQTQNEQSQEQNKQQQEQQQSKPQEHQQQPQQQQNEQNSNTTNSSSNDNTSKEENKSTETETTTPNE